MSITNKITMTKNESADVPRFVQVTEADSDRDDKRVFVNVDKITFLLPYGKAGTSICLDVHGDYLAAIEPIEIIISRIREVGGVVSGWEEPTNAS